MAIRPCRECSSPVHSAADRCACGAVLPGRPLSVPRIEEPFDYSTFVRALTVSDGANVRTRVSVDLEGMRAAVDAERALLEVERRPRLRLER